MKIKEQLFPTSLAEKQCWFFEKINTEISVPSMVYAVTLRGDLNSELLSDALLKSVCKNDILSSVFIEDTGKLFRKLTSSIDLPLKLIALPRTSKVNALINDLIQKETSNFTLTQNTLCWKTILVEVSENEHVFICIFHDIICDGIPSFNILMNQVLSFYNRNSKKNSILKGVEPHDLLVSQLGDLDSIDNNLSAFLSSVGDEVQVARLPKFKNSMLKSSLTCNILRDKVSSNLSEMIKKASLLEGVSQTDIYLFALMGLLYKYNSNKNTSISRITSSRAKVKAFENIAQLSAIELVISNISENTKFSEYRNLLSESTLLKPFSTFSSQGRAGPAHGHNQNLLFDSKNILFNSDLDFWQQHTNRHEGKLTLDTMHLDSVKSLYELEFHIRKYDDSEVVEIYYNPEIYDKAIIKNFIKNYFEFLKNGLNQQTLKLSEIKYIDSSEYKKITSFWNSVEELFAEMPITHLIDFQASKNPNLIAIEHNGKEITYAELIENSNKLAKLLTKRGVKSEDMVALCFDRSIDLVTAILAIWKCGACVVPIDPLIPFERLKGLIKNAEINFVATDLEFLKKKQEIYAILDGIEIVDCTFKEVNREEQTGKFKFYDLSHLDIDKPAYCIYTSGSTGVPKGVLVNHRVLCNLYGWHSKNWLVDTGTRTLLYSPIFFDVGFHELVVGLCSGARLVQVDEEIRANALLLTEFAINKKIEKWYMPYVALQQVAQVATDYMSFESLKEVIVGGEPLRITAKIREFARNTGCIIHNHYGSTECLEITTCTLSGNVDTWPENVPIGRANVQNMNCFILDPNFMPVPIGVEGEIYAAGKLLSSGYLNIKKLNEEKFIDNPFEVQGNRLYKTGDLARYRLDGNIEYIGRRDHQVKVRGYRVDLSEIETVLHRHCNVVDCKVIARKEPSANIKIIAYVVKENPEFIDDSCEDIIKFSKDFLPDYMVPASIVFLDKFPLTSTGKLDIKKLSEVIPVKKASKNMSSLGGKRILLEIEKIWANILNVDNVEHDRSFFELGGDSLLLIMAHQKICNELGLELPPTTMFRYTTIKTLAEHIESLSPNFSINSQAKSLLKSDASLPKTDDIAIIGMSCRLPGANNIDEFWSNLCEGKESILPVAKNDIHELSCGMSDELNFVNAAATISHIDKFDASFFGYSAAEAEIIDPQQRMFLEASWQAMENAGLPLNNIENRVGVFAGSAMSTYLINNVLPAKLQTSRFLSHRYFKSAVDLRIEQGNARDHLPMRVSYKLNLKGPSVNVQTTCSTSLVAVRMACQAIQNNDCEVAIAGGVAVISPQNTGYVSKEAMILSKDGHCRAFDANADGTVFGNGLGVVILKEREAAERDGDHIYAIIKGSAINNDGSRKVNYSAPSSSAQADVIVSALEAAGVSSNTISYIEAHGTGTILGDPIEFEGIKDAFNRASDGSDIRCSIGTVKTNIGHLDEAAGVVGLIKTALALHYKKLPPSLNYNSPNPKLEIEKSPFKIQSKLSEWRNDNIQPLRAGVSSFGMGGTNCHIILEEASLNNEGSDFPPVNKPLLLLISGKTPSALKRNAEEYRLFLAKKQNTQFANICYSSAIGREHFDYRLALDTENHECALNQLEAKLGNPKFEWNKCKVKPLANNQLVFMFTGQGSQFSGMGRVLYESQPVFKEVLDNCANLLEADLDIPLISLMFDKENKDELKKTRNAQPAIFSLGCAFAELWKSWGITPDLLIGHSLGEFIAAKVSGIFSLQDGLKLVSARGRLMQELPEGGGMFQVYTTHDTVLEYIKHFGDAVTVAAINCPNVVVISGKSDALKQIGECFNRDEILYLKLEVSHAFHSKLMIDMLGDFEKVARSINYSNPKIDLVSNVTGKSIEAGEINAEYWVKHVLSPVKFQSGIAECSHLGSTTFLEIGPKPALTAFARKCLSGPDFTFLQSLSFKDPTLAYKSCLALYMRGIDINWHEFYRNHSLKKVAIPTYSFARERHWVEYKKNMKPSESPASDIKNVEINTSTITEILDSYKLEWVKLEDRNDCISSFTPAIVLECATSQSSVLSGDVETSEFFSISQLFEGQTEEEEDQVYEKIKCALDAHGNSKADLNVIMNTKGCDSTDPVHLSSELLKIVKNISKLLLSSARPITLWILAQNESIDSVMGRDALSHSVLSGLIKVINAEYSDINSKCLYLTSKPTPHEFETAAYVMTKYRDTFVEEYSIKGQQIFCPKLHRITELIEDKNEYKNIPIQPNRSYIITGGTRGIGLSLALEISYLKPKKIYLISRSGKLRPDDLEIWRNIEKTKVDIELIKADVSNRAQLEALFTKDIKENLGGVFHCAGNLNDGILLKQTHHSMLSVLNPKIAGAWNLHEITKNVNLDFFVMFSSTASVFGYRGQSSYGAANAFLDSLAYYRTQRQLPALSISWGSWAKIGMTSRMQEKHINHLFSAGEKLIEPAAGLRALAYHMKRDLAHIIVTSMNWESFAKTITPRISLIEDLISDGIVAYGSKKESLEGEPATGVTQEIVASHVNRMLGNPPSTFIDRHLGFVEMGIDSLGAIDLRVALQESFNIRLPVTVIFDQVCIEDLVNFINDQIENSIVEDTILEHITAHGAEFSTHNSFNKSNNFEHKSDSDIAIIGMACRFPKANSPEEFWRLIKKGQNAVERIKSDRWDVDACFNSDPDAEGKIYIQDAALVEDCSGFDSSYFGISPREARSMDPRHRMLLETSYQAIENAGIKPSSLRGQKIGVYIGGDEFINGFLDGVIQDTLSEPYRVTGNTLSFAAGRISYKLGIHGPSTVIASACSSSLVALHMAAQGIKNGDCDMALVGGVKLIFGADETMHMCKLKALSPDGRSKAFSLNADGFGRGEGCGVVLIKAVEKAQQDGDPILAVIKGSAVNHDGPSSGLTVPNRSAQRELIESALRNAQLKPDDIIYIETHGTGTSLGDPIELNALNDVFSGGRVDPLYLGGVKANIGHLEEAAGIASLIKVIMSMKSGIIPEQLYASSPTNKFDWNNSPLKLPDKNSSWPSNRDKLVGISSFGMSGTNAHVIIGNYEKLQLNRILKSEECVFSFSAKSKIALKQLVSTFIADLDLNEAPIDIAYTLHSGREFENERLAIVASDTLNLLESLKKYLNGSLNDKNIFTGLVTEKRTDAETYTLIKKLNTREIATLWCNGEALNILELYEARAVKRLNLTAIQFEHTKNIIHNRNGNNKRLERITVKSDEIHENLLLETNKPEIVYMQNDFQEDIIIIDLREHLASLLGMNPGEITNDKPFDELGTDSLTFMRMSQFLRDKFNVVSSFQQLIEDINTLSELNDFVHSNLDRTKISYEGQSEKKVQRDTSTKVSMNAAVANKTSGNYRQILHADKLAVSQKQFLQSFVQEYTQRTKNSKNDAENYRNKLANCRMPPFQPHTKEISYPIIAQRSEGAYFWDIDGNKYIDISMGYGVHLFGHKPEFLTQALLKQIHNGVYIGPQSEQAGEAARLLSDLTGLPRVAFCNSGTEAVMAAIRFARAATNRTKFVMFEGSYHGWSDSTLALSAGTESSIAMARGIGEGAMMDVIVLEYGTDESLEVIKNLAPDLAAVLVEPVQSRRPDFQPIDFLRSLRKVTEDCGTALIFDEVITGFRIASGGIQEKFGIKADIATYGKVLGGGTPIGAVAGSGKFMDTIDGGMWNFGDETAPKVPTTFFGGTFNKNPLSMAAAKSVLEHIKLQTPEIQNNAADLVERLAEKFNVFCESENFPMKIVYFSSMFRFIGEGEYSLQRFPLSIDLFFQMMALKGIYILETRVCFLSEAHTEKDVDSIINAAFETLISLRASSFFKMAENLPDPNNESNALLGSTSFDTVLKTGYNVAKYANNNKNPKNILLTGATGFLGSFLLYELLKNNDVKIYCLVRPNSKQPCLERIAENMQHWKIWDERFSERIEIFEGDLSQHLLGMSQEKWDWMAQNIDVIIHNGAWVNSILPYARLRSTNVLGTKTLLNLAAQDKGKYFHHISSDAVFDAYGYLAQRTIFEDESLRHINSQFGGGYGETKWVADKLVENAREKGLRAFIFRPGMITGHSKNGIGQTDDFFASFILGTIQLGLSPDLNAIIDIAPVDYVSKSIIDIALSVTENKNLGANFHLTNPKPIKFSDFIKTIDGCGFGIKTVPYQEWIDSISTLKYEDGNALYPLLPLFTDSSDPFLRSMQLNVSNTLNISKSFKNKCMKVPSLMKLYLESYVRDGILQDPKVK